MGGTNKEPKNSVFYNLKSKASAKETPHFAKIGKVDDKWETIESFNCMEGKLIGARIKERPDDKGKPIKSFILIFNDGVETSDVNMNHTQVTYSIINSLASLPVIDGNLSITVDKKEDGKYINARAFVKHNDQDVKWLIPMVETPRKTPVMVPDPSNPGAQMQLEVNGEKVWDSTEVKAYWEKFFLDNVVPKVKSVTLVSQSEASKAFIEDMNSDNPSDDSDTDPF